MTPSNGSIFRVTGHLCGEFTGHRWIPRRKASDAELWCSLICAWINGWVTYREAGDVRCHRTNYDVIVMSLKRIHWPFVVSHKKMPTESASMSWSRKRLRPAPKLNGSLGTPEVLSHFLSVSMKFNCNRHGKAPIWRRTKYPGSTIWRHYIGK